MKNTKKMVFLSLLVGIALAIYIVEAQIPVLFPGIKLGLSNAVSLLALVTMGGKEALIIMILRVLLGSIFIGNMSSLIFSISGGILSNAVMIFLYKHFNNNFSISSISVIGAIFHNIGQLLAAAFIIKDMSIYVYFPILLISAVITGYFIGIVTSLLKIRLKNKIKF